jgi:hypothetical protein
MIVVTNRRQRTNAQQPPMPVIGFVNAGSADALAGIVTASQGAW